jgi:hypothetical protein
VGNNQSGNVSLVRGGKRFTGYYFVDGDFLQVSTEIGTMRRPIMNSPVKELAEQMLAKLVREEEQS